MDLNDLKDDPEFAEKIPPLTPEEFEQLEANILADGVVINPLIVWNGVIVDGHNRYRILQTHPEIPYQVHEKEFLDRYEVIAWICKNQLGRRNLTPAQRKYLIGKKYKEQRIISTELLIPRNTYQRELNTDRVHKIVKQFDERVANEPKVSFRDGNYYVFDGQHTIAARVERNGGNPLMILCKVYYGLTEKEEARLFAEQTGFSADLGSGPRIRALVFAEDEQACNFIKATEAAGARIDYAQRRARNRLACVSTAFKEFQKVGREKYTDALRILLEA